MGLEAECKVRYGGEEVIARVHLDTAKLDVRGALRLSIPFSAIQKLEAKRGVLLVGTSQGKLELELGRAAETWFLKLRYPKGRLDKLGVKAGQRVAVVGLDDA